MTKREMATGPGLEVDQEGEMRGEDRTPELPTKGTKIKEILLHDTISTEKLSEKGRLPGKLGKEMHQSLGEI